MVVYGWSNPVVVVVLFFGLFGPISGMGLLVFLFWVTSMHFMLPSVPCPNGARWPVAADSCSRNNRPARHIADGRRPVCPVKNNEGGKADRHLPAFLAKRSLCQVSAQRPVPLQPPTVLATSLKRLASSPRQAPT